MQGFMGISSTLCQTHAKSGSLLSNVANHLERKVQPTIIIQEMQIIKVKQHSITYINQIRFIKLLRDECHKQAVYISESRDNSNQCTPCRENLDQHNTRFPRSVRV
jgi:hypothetical protein